MKRRMGGVTVDRAAKIPKHTKEEYRTQEELRKSALRQEKILGMREHNTSALKEIGITLSPKTGRNLIKNHAGIYSPETIKKQIAHVKKKQKEFKEDETTEQYRIKKRSELAEEIITAELTKCLSEEFYFYRSNLFGDIRGGYDIVGIDQETGQTEFVIDVTLGTNNPDNPINTDKVKKTHRNNRNGVMVYDGYKEQEDGMYTPAYDIMAPLLSISLPDKGLKGEDNLMNIIDRMSQSFEEPSKGDLQNTLYLIQRLIKSLINISSIDDPEKNHTLFNVQEIQKRAGSLYGMLSPKEKVHWKSVPEEVQFEIEEWKNRIEDLLDRFYEIEKKIAEKIGIDPEIFWEMT